MIEFKAPNIPKISYRIFLGGSIEMGAAEKWQDKVVEALKDTDHCILNPRRDDWDSSWKQEIGAEGFDEQVRWELASLEMADVILIHFDPATKSPISLLELGLYAKSGKLVVSCPEGFWKKGNVDIVCDSYNIDHTDSLEEAIQYLQSLSSHNHE